MHNHEHRWCLRILAQSLIERILLEKIMSQHDQAIGHNLYELIKVQCIKPSLPKFPKNKTNREVKTGSVNFHGLNTVWVSIKPSVIHGNNFNKIKIWNSNLKNTLGLLGFEKIALADF